MILHFNYNNKTKIDLILCAYLNEDTQSWFYENYINLIIRMGSYICIDFEDIMYPSFNLVSTIRTNSCDEIESSEKLLQLIKKRIDRGFYSTIYLDEYYLKESFKYKIDSSLVPVFIYGYDDEKEIILAAFHDSIKGILKIEICYDFLKDFYNFFQERSFENFSQAQTEEYLISYFLTDNFRGREFRLDNFLTNLNKYIFSISTKPGIVSGLSVYDVYIKIVEKNDLPVVLRGVENLCVHKAYMLERLKYISNLYAISAACLNSIFQYEHLVVKECDRLKMLVIKQLVKEGVSFMFLSQDADFRKKIIEKCKKIQESEQSLLPLIYTELKNTQYKKGMSNMITEYRFNVIDNNTLKISFFQPVLLARIDLIDNRPGINYASYATLSFDDGTEYLINDSSYYLTKCRECLFTPKIVSWFILRQTDLTYMNKDSFCFQTIPNEQVWENDDLLKWEAVQQFSQIEYNKIIEAIVYNNNPNLVLHNNYLNADVSKYIYIKYKTSSPSLAGQVCFKSSAFPYYSFDKQKTFTIIPGGSVYEYKIDMSDNKFWKGIITELRFDPVHYDHKGSSDVKIYSIKVSDEKPIYDSKQDFCETQGVNGWFYYSYNGAITYKELVWEKDRIVWVSDNNDGLKISDTYQTSCNQFYSVRKWVCPASAKYTIKCDFLQENQNFYTVFTIKKNYKVLYTISENLDKEHSYQKHIRLSTGDNVSFEFLNKDECTIEKIMVDISIKKETDETVVK